MFDIVNRDCSSRSNQTPQLRPRQCAPEWCETQWSRLYGKIRVLIRFTRDAMCVKRMIGNENFKKMVLDENDLERMATQEHRRREERTPRLGAVHGKQFLFGTMLTPWKGQPDATADPLSCEHPDEALALSSNKYLRAVYCKKCHCRWSRTDLDQLENPDTMKEEPRDDHLILYGGTYLNWSYLEVYNYDPGYCQWTLRTANFQEGTMMESSARLRHFALYIYRKSNNGQDPIYGPNWKSVRAHPKAATANIASSSNSRAPKAPGPLLAVHLPDAERQGIPNPELTSDRHRTIAMISAAQDAAGDAVMSETGLDNWEFPQEPLPPSFGK